MSAIPHRMSTLSEYSTGHLWRPTCSRPEPLSGPDIREVERLVGSRSATHQTLPAWLHECIDHRTHSRIGSGRAVEQRDPVAGLRQSDRTLGEGAAPSEK